MKIRPMLISVALVSGCAASIPTVSDKALNVQVHTQMSTLLDSCKKLGQVNSREASISGWTSSAYEMAALAAENSAREKAADLGADTIAILQSDFVGFEGSKAVMQVQGIAYKCD